METLWTCLFLDTYIHPLIETEIKLILNTMEPIFERDHADNT